MTNKTHLERDLERLDQHIVDLASLVERALEQAYQALLKQDVSVAQLIHEQDAEIDRFEVAFEEECQRLITLNQPVARDFRHIAGALRTNNDLERIGDLAVWIGHSVIELKRLKAGSVDSRLLHMLEQARAMVRESLDAMMREDAELALRVCTKDTALREEERHVRGKIREDVAQDGTRIDCAMQLIDVASSSVRIAELATNIAEDVYYRVNGKIIRHGRMQDVL